MKLLTCALLLSLVSARADEPKKADLAEEKVATSRATAIGAAFDVYHLVNGAWPKKLGDVEKYLNDGKKALSDPWGKEYKFELRDEKQADGDVSTRVYVWTERVVGKEIKVYGTKPPEVKKK